MTYCVLFMLILWNVWELFTAAAAALCHAGFVWPFHFSLLGCHCSGMGGNVCVCVCEKHTWQIRRPATPPLHQPTSNLLTSPTPNSPSLPPIIASSSRCLGLWQGESDLCLRWVMSLLATWGFKSSGEETAGTLLLCSQVIKTFFLKRVMNCVQLDAH